MKFFTWNSQGDFTKSAKKAVIEELFLNQDCSVGFIQEGGVDNDMAVIGAGVSVYGGSQVGAKNERCTTYVLARNDVFQGGGEFERFSALGGGVAARGLAAFRFGGAIYGSWHSSAIPSNSDTADLIKECKKKTGVNTIVIGGDFNTKPAEIQAMINRNARASRGQSDWFCSLFNSGSPTHKSGRELDFFVVLHTGAANGAQVRVRTVNPSDHNPVVLDVNI